MKKTLSVIFCLLLCLFPLVSCNRQDDKNVLKINEVTHSVFYAPLYLADSLGYFKEEGISIELTNGGGADKVMSAVLSGDAQIGFCGPEAALYVLAGGSTDVPTVFGQLTKRDGTFLVSRKAEPDFKWSDLKGKEILAGRKGGVPAMTFEYLLNQKGLYDKQDVTLNFDVAFNLMTAAFESGVADYCTMFEPTASEYQAAGKGYIVASVGQDSGEIPYTCFMAKKSWINKNTKKVEGFLRAVTKAIRFTHQSTPEQIAPHLVSYFSSTPLSSLIASIKSYQDSDAWVENMAMKEEAFNRLQDVIDNAGELPKRVGFTSLIENKYAQTVYDNLIEK